MKNQNKKTNRFSLRYLLTAVCAIFLLSTPVHAADSLQNHPAYTGMLSLLNDLTTALTVLCPITGAVAALFFVIRRSIADEQDGKIWTKRITTAIICGVGGMLISGIITLLTSYFGG